MTLEVNWFFAVPQVVDSENFIKIHPNFTSYPPCTHTPWTHPRTHKMTWSHHILGSVKYEVSKFNISTAHCMLDFRMKKTHTTNTICKWKHTTVASNTMQVMTTKWTLEIVWTSSHTALTNRNRYEMQLLMLNPTVTTG